MKKKLTINKGDVQELSFEETLDRYKKLIIESFKPFVKYYEFEDLLQIGSLGLWKAYRDYDEEKGVGFGYYARFYIRNTLYNHFRSQYRHNVKYCSYNEVFNYDGQNLQLIDILESPVNEIEMADNRMFIQDLLSNLTDQQREIMVLKLEGYKQTDIADKMNTTQAWVSRSLLASRKKLLKLA